MPHIIWQSKKKNKQFRKSLSNLRKITIECYENHQSEWVLQHFYLRKSCFIFLLTTLHSQHEPFVETYQPAECFVSRIVPSPSLNHALEWQDYN